MSKKVPKKRAKKRLIHVEKAASLLGTVEKFGELWLPTLKGGGLVIGKGSKAWSWLEEHLTACPEHAELKPSSWRQLSPLLKAKYYQLALYALDPAKTSVALTLARASRAAARRGRASYGVYTFDLRLAAEIQTKALQDPAEAADFLRRRMNKKFSKSPIWFVVEQDSKLGLHIHGFVGLMSAELEEAKADLYQVAGLSKLDVDDVGFKSYALRLKIMPSYMTGCGKVNYAFKHLADTQRALGSKPVAATNRVIALAREIHRLHREALVGISTALMAK